MECGGVLLSTGAPFAYYCYIHIGWSLAFVDVFVRRLLDEAGNTCIVNNREPCVVRPYNYNDRGNQPRYIFAHLRSIRYVTAERWDCVSA